MSKSATEQMINRKERAERKKGSISFKISLSLLAVLIPFLMVFILISCMVAADTISLLNNKLLDAQTDYAVSRVDDFFRSKMAAVTMFEKNGDLQSYFRSVSTAHDIGTYGDRDKVIDVLSDALGHMEDDKVLQAWVADERSDSYLLSSGEVVAADLKDTAWYQSVLSYGKAMVTDPFLDPATGEVIVSVIAPVYTASGKDVAGFMGLDVYLDTLSQVIGSIKIGEEGYLELVSRNSYYIYSNDPGAMGRNVDELDISQDYKDKVRNNYNGAADFSYDSIRYTAVFQNSETTGWLAIATLPISEVNATRNSLIGILAGLSIVMVALMVFVIVVIIRRMVKPLSEISSSMEEFASGNLAVDIRADSDDEIGRLAESARTSVRSLKDIMEEISYVLKEISGGNLNLAVHGSYMGDFSVIREALEQIIRSLNDILGQINASADQVSCGSEQVSVGAQSLAHGATEQAGSVESLASVINDLSQQISANAGRAAKGSQMAYAVGDEALLSDRRMQEMQEAMHDIKIRSNKIRDIIKTIEDIAFQTNILALNAAVEAARAGDAGRGFSVVAGEVRNLASKSAEASRNTTALINGSLDAVENGTKLVDETARSLKHVVSGVEKMVAEMDGISAASREQAHSVEQVTQEMEQIADIIQGNSATAEESAAASEELSAQALLLKGLIQRIRFMDSSDK